MLKLNLEKPEEQEIKLTTSVGLSKKQESSRKQLLLLYWLCQSLWLCGSQQLWKILKEMGIPETLPASCMQVKKQQLELDLKLQTGSELGKEYVKAVLYIVTLLI